ncbi:MULTISPECIES: cell division protein ZapA [unclassified Sphingopyxis]|jgi:cell division protein ZapA|uniref:cell division protein ZapA n=1 Tax=unclassified Sphingopyxis TaxID=2614943 RepID=UPI002865BC83|nr:MULTISPECIES: cell division protein ZapA [unclassified Sphingopyxis]MDR6835169.1 cell division protein ZapA [Sphingopyxis sp. BE122]MDR7227376.1 cell division protein ZapA [Sphingopyxis sp. BE259]
MADVRLTIAGRPYDVHCADGEEAQLLQLAAVVDEKARGINGGTEVRQLLFAALMLADDAQEAKGKVDKAEPQSDSLRAAVALAESREAATRDELRAAVAREQAALKELEAARAAPAAPSPAKPANDRALLQIADRIEALATKVEQIP